MELGLIGTPSLSFENEKITDKQLVPCIFATLGAMYKFQNIVQKPRKNYIIEVSEQEAIIQPQNQPLKFHPSRWC